MSHHIADAHSQWHSIHGDGDECPLDCGAGGFDRDEPEEPRPYRRLVVDGVVMAQSRRIDLT
jgi:hypothetical protein